MNLNLFMAAIWAVLGFGILVLLPSAEQNPIFDLSPERRYMLGGFAWVLVGWNIVRWRLGRLRRQAEEESRMYRETRRPRREPPNPDFDFSDPKPGGGPPNPSGPRNGSG